MAHPDLTFSLTDSDLVGGMVRSLLALHQPYGDGETCVECLSVYPCPTVRIIAATQDAAVARVADPQDRKWSKRPSRPPAPDPNGIEFVPQEPKGHNFKYPECPEFSGGICPIHHGQPIAGVA
jgi:hypothetical protein